MNEPDDIHKRIKAMSDVVNAFKSEAVQLRVVEVLLGHLGVSAAKAGNIDPKPQRRSKRRKTSTNTETPAGSTEKPKPQKAGRASARGSASPGAFAMINQLLADRFFKTPRTIAAIVAHCGTSKGHHYKANECSPGLLRLLRDGKLKREKNKDGQYEYTQT